jgi:cytochrome c oxidase subunit 1
VLPVFSRKPLFGYPFVVFSGVAIGFMGWGVWAHHMFASGLGPVSIAVFSATTMFIAVPTGVKIINWIGTMWGGRLSFTTAMLFAIGLIVLFTVGGLSGVTHAVSPSDTQQTDTYYIVAHFHYVLFGGAVFGLFSGFYYWWPKVFGRMLSERLGRWNFWFMAVGMNLTFGPMHIVGLQGQMRRGYHYPDYWKVSFWNLVSSIGAFILAIGILFFIINVVKTMRKPKNAPLDPWDARSLEWLTATPPKEHNFDVIPTVHTIDEYFHLKYEEDEETGELTQVRTAEEIHEEQERNADEHIHMPSPSYWPLILALGLPVVAFGAIYNHLISVVGVAIILFAIWGWALEPATADPGDFDPPPSDSKELATLG